MKVNQDGKKTAGPRKKKTTFVNRASASLNRNNRIHISTMNVDENPDGDILTASIE